VSLTVKQLVEHPLLRTRILAGGSGADNPVLWAHTCELPDPWNWLGTGDLLLTDGYNVPTAAEEQVEFLRNLADAHLSGIALAEGLHAPPLTPEAAAVADALAFPVLETAYAVPFVTVARTVADSNSEEASSRLTRILRVYDVLRRSQQGGGHGRPLLAELGKEAGAELHVIDTRDGRPLLPASRPLGDDVRAALRELAASQRGPLPGFLRVPVGAASVLVLPVGAEGRAAMVAEPVAGSRLDLVVLQHVATIAAIDVERLEAAAVRRRVSGARLFRQLVDGTIDTETAAARLGATGLGERPWRVVSWGADGPTAEDLQMRLAAAGVPHLLLPTDRGHLALVPDARLGDDVWGLAADAGARIGLSQPVQAIGRIADAVREARWAMESAGATGAGVVTYGVQGALFLPRTVAEGEAVVDAILGPLIAYDRANDSELVRSLEVFFEAKKSWQEGAKRLDIHKQTLVYRMRRVEELTHRQLSDLDDQTELYLALRALRMLRAE
jgi:purine catabolism regulator